jgi:hypothetical protein
MSQWTVQDPGAGDTAGVRAMAMDTLVRCLDDARSRFRGHYDGVTPVVWSGQAGEAFRATGAAYLADLGALINALAPYAGALQTYAGQVESIAEEAARIERSWQDAQDDITAARRVVPHYAQSDDLTDAQKRAQSSLVAARRVQSGLELQRDDLVARRQSADRVAADALRAAPVADWTVVGAAMAAAGMTRPEAFTTLAVRDALVELSEQVLDGDRDAVAGLTALLAAWGGSATLMSQYLDTLGGAKTAGLVNALGDDFQRGGDQAGPALALALAVRAALSRGSATWGRTQARGFADELMGAGRAGGAIAFLFGDWQGDPMGKNLTVEMADRIDAVEREQGTSWWGVGTSGAALLAANRLVDDPRHGVDPGGAVLGTLGQYPDAALDWLTDPDLGDRRIEYWYGERDGGLPGDGFAGVGALWDGIFHIEGGLDHPESLDLDTVERWADTVSKIMGQLAQNESYTPFTISAVGGGSIAGAIGDMLLLISEVPLTEMPDEYRDAVNADGVYHVGERPETPIPVFKHADLGRILGVAATQGDGVLAYGAAVAETTTAVLSSIDPSAATYGEDIAAAMKQIAATLALADGAEVGVHVTEAVRTALVEKSFFDGVGTITGLVSLDAPPVLTGLGAAMWDVGSGLAQDVAASAIPDPLEVMRHAIDQSVVAQDERDAAARSALDAAAQAITEAYERSTGNPIESDRQQGWVDSAMSDYDARRGNLAWHAVAAGA